MKIDDILGRREDQRLEFKAAAVLEEPSQVARAVVGMLNAEGGEIWIGVDEENEAAVALEPVSDPEEARRRLHDHLLDSLDPSPLPEEVSIELVPPGADAALLVLHVRPSRLAGRTPFAYRKGGRWHFLRRAGARNHPMSRQEIFGIPVFGAGGEESDDALGKLVKEREAQQRAAESGLWIALRPVRRIEIDLQHDLLEHVALVPSITGNRQGGWHFARSSTEPSLGKERLQWEATFGGTPESTTQVQVFGDGELRFLASLPRLRWKGEENELWPIALLEYLVSAFRISRRIYKEQLSTVDEIAVDVALLGVGGWGLREGSPADPFFTESDLVLQEEPDLIWEPLVLRFGDIEESPDRCGYRFVRRIYQAFGLRETAIPPEFDRRTGRLVLPD